MIVNLPYPKGMRPGGNFLEDGSTRRLVNVRFVAGKWATRGGNVQAHAYSMQHLTQFDKEGLVNDKLGEGVGLYSYRRRGIAQLLIAVFRARDSDRAMEVAILRGPRAIATATDAAVFSADVIGFRPVSFAELNGRIYMAGPFSRGLFRIHIVTSDQIDMGYLEPIDRRKIRHSELDDSGTYLTASPVFKFVFTHQNRVYGVDSEIGTRLRASNLNDGDAYPGNNFLDINDAGDLTGGLSWGRYAVLFTSSGRVFMYSGAPATDQGATRDEVNNPFNDFCISHYSIVKTPHGIVFLGTRGIYILHLTELGYRIDKMSEAINHIFTGERDTYQGYTSDNLQIIRQGLEYSHAVYVPSRDMYVCYVPAWYTTSPHIIATLHGVKSAPTLGICNTFGQGIHIDQGRCVYAMCIDQTPSGVERWLGCDHAGGVHDLDYGTHDTLLRTAEDQLTTSHAQVQSKIDYTMFGGGERANYTKLEVLVEPRGALTGLTPSGSSSGNTILSCRSWSGDLQSTLGVKDNTLYFPYLSGNKLLSATVTPITLSVAERSAARIRLRHVAGRSATVSLGFIGRFISSRLVAVHFRAIAET